MCTIQPALRIIMGLFFLNRMQNNYLLPNVEIIYRRDKKVIYEKIEILQLRANFETSTVSCPKFMVDQ